MNFYRNLLIAIVALPTSTEVSLGVRHLAGASKVCELVTRPEAAAALGAAVPSGKETFMNMTLGSRLIKMEVCLYGSEVLVARYELGSGAPALFDQYRQSLALSDGFRNVSGVGDEAFAAKGQLYVRQGQSGLNVDIGQARGGGAKELDGEKRLALIALGRM